MLVSIESSFARFSPYLSGTIYTVDFIFHRACEKSCGVLSNNSSIQHWKLVIYFLVTRTLVFGKICKYEV